MAELTFPAVPVKCPVCLEQIGTADVSAHGVPGPESGVYVTASLDVDSFEAHMLQRHTERTPADFEGDAIVPPEQW